MTYNLSSFDNSTDILQMTSAANNLSGGFFIIMLLLLVWIITAVGLSKVGFKNSSLIASFGTSIISFIFLFVGLIGMPVFIVCLVLLLANLVISLISKD